MYVDFFCDFIVYIGSYHMSFNYPLILEPISVPRPWGAGLVADLYNGRKSGASNIGESWDISTWPVDPGDPSLVTVNKIVNGPLAGKLLDSVIDVPVVVKILDTCEKLSVQIHPTDEGKTKDEMWYILNATPEAYLFLGLNDGVDAGDYCDKAADSSLSETEVISLLKKYDNLKSGDYFNVPTGTIHAVGPHIVAFEVSEKCQITYRLYDYNRGRALHLEDGKTAAVSTRIEKSVLDVSYDIECDNINYITNFPTFWVSELCGNDVTINSVDADHILTAVTGDLELLGPDENWNITVKNSMSVLVPGGYSYKIKNSGNVCLITPFAGNNKESE